MGFQISFLDRWLKFSSFILFLFIFACIIPVFATHTATVTISPQYVLGGSTDIYTFTITNNPDSSNFIYYLKISAPSGFTIDSDVSCPSGWGVNIAADGSYVECSGDPDPNENKKIDIGESKTISFKATSNSAEDTYQWTVLTKDNAFCKEYNYPTTTVDNTKPTVTSVSSDGAIYNTQTQSPVTITVIFSENISNTPTIKVDSEPQTVNDCGDNDPKTFCFNYAIPASTQATKTITISSAKDLAGNEMEEDSTHTFRVDTKLPSISSLSISPTTINESSVGIAKFTITIQYSEEMDTSITPTIIFTPPIGTTLTNCTGSWSDSYSYMYTCDIEDNDVEQPNINVTVSGAKDLAGNEQEDYTLTNVIRVDTKAPVDPTNVYVEAGPNNEANVINIYNKNSVNVAVVFSSVPEAGTVIVELSDGTNTITSTAPANTEGTITTVTNINATSLNDGAITVKAKIVDNAGNGNPSGFVTGTAATKDTQVPTVFTLTVSPTIVNEASVGIDKFTITIDYSEEMDTSTNPTITSNPSVDTTLTNCEGSWLDSDTYTFTCDVEDVNVEQSGIDFTISGAKDLTGNEQEVYIKEDAFDVDTLAPEFTNIFPPSNSYINASSSIQYTLNDDIISGEINFIDSSNNVLTYTLKDSYLEPGTHTIPLSSLGITLTDGETYNISFYGIDAAGNEVTITNTNITYDETPPITVEIINPSDGAYVKGIVTIKVNAVDNEIGSGIAKVEFYLNETILGIDENPADGWSYGWDTTEVTDGNYSLTAKAIDKAGNSKTSAAISVTVDNTPPEIITYILDNPVFSPNDDGVKDNVTIDLEFSEEVYVDVDILNSSGEVIRELYHPPYDVKNPDPKMWNGTDNSGNLVDDGVYTIRIVITDLAGNSVTDTSKTVIVDTKAPIVTVNPLITNDTTPQLTGTVDDATAIVNVTVNGNTYTATVSPVSNDEGTYNWIANITDPLGDGTYDVSVTAIDQAGNIGNNVAQLTIDTKSPTISSFDSPIANKVYKNSNVTLQFTSTDPSPGTNLSCFYVIDNNNPVEVSCQSGTEVDTTITDLSDGRHYLTLTVTDAAGNSVSDSVSFVVDLDNTLTVDDDGGADFTSIQDAINAASDGDTIIVYGGTYSEQLIINKSIILIAEGSNSTLDFSGYSGYGIKIIADGVTIDGFKIIGVPVGASGEDWYTKKASNIDPTILVEANNILVQNCIFNNASGIPAKEAMLVNGGYRDITFDNNVVNNYIWGVTGRGTTKQPYQGTDNLTVRNNIFNIAYIRNDNVGVNNHTEIIGAAVQLWYGENIKVINNDFNGPGKFDESLADEDLINVYAYADFIALFEDMYGINLTGIVDIQNNTVDNFYLSFGFFAKGGTVQGNKISNCLIGMQLGQNSPWYASAGTSGLDINNNEITNNKLGIWAQNIDPGIIVHFNNIYGNEEYGILNNDTDTLNAEYNYWGCAEGPENESCDSVSENVDYDPWLKASKDSAPVRENGAPTGYVNKTTLTLSLTTDRPATCRYSEEEGKDYDSMEGMFNTSDGLYHYTELSNLPEGKHTYYVKCKSEIDGMPANSDDYVISFTVDLTSPQIVERSPGINAVGVDPATNITVKFSENVTCSLGGWENCTLVSSEKGKVKGNIKYYNKTLIFVPCSPLYSDTEFTVNLTGITDLAGNSLEGITEWKFITATYYSIELTPGWNLISIPVVPENTSIEVVLGDAEGKIEGIWTYDAVNEEWYVYHPNNSTTSNLDTMIPGYGYWIKAKENATIKGYGSLFREREVPPQRILVPGWNLIGYYQKPGEEEAPVYCALSSLLKYYCVGDCCNVPISERYWTSLVTYDNHRKVFEEIGPDDITEPGKGYWIFMRSSEIDNYLYGPGETCE